MDQHQEQSALNRVRLTEKAAQLRAASDSLDGILSEVEHLARADQHDLAFAIFASFKGWMIDFESDTGLYVTDEEFADVWLRTLTHLPEDVAVDLLGERFAEDKHLRTAAGIHVNWHAANYEAVLVCPGVTLVMSHSRTIGALMERAS